MADFNSNRYPDESMTRDYCSADSFYASTIMTNAVHDNLTNNKLDTQLGEETCSLIAALLSC